MMSLQQKISDLFDNYHEDKNTFLVVFNTKCKNGSDSSKNRLAVQSVAKEVAL